MHIPEKIYGVIIYVLLKNESINLLLLTISANGHLDELQKAEKYPIRWSL